MLTSSYCCMIETAHRVSSSVNVMIGNADLVNVEPAHCELNVMTYGCTGCIIKPYAVFQPFNIKDEGILPFISNCSFSRSYLRCNYQAYKLELQDNSRNCMNFLKTLNKIFHINFDYEFIGSIDLSKTIEGIETISEAFSKIGKNPNFLNRLTDGLTTFIISGTIIAIISRISKLIILYKASKEANSKV